MNSIYRVTDDCICAFRYKWEEFNFYFRGEIILFCKNCNSKLDEDTKFCSNCGLKIEYLNNNEILVKPKEKSSISHKKIVMIAVSVLVILLGACFYYYFSKLKPYNDALTKAEQSIIEEQYDKAITYYTEALYYKKDANVSKKIEITKLLIKSKETYDSGIKQMNNKKYLEAIDTFKKIDKQDDKRYAVAKNKINECKKAYIDDNLKTANDNFKNSKFDEANKYLDNVLKLDANNTDAKKLKDNVAKAYQNQKNLEVDEDSIGRGVNSFSTTVVKDYDKSIEDNGPHTKEAAANILRRKLNMHPKDTLMYNGNNIIDGNNCYCFVWQGFWSGEVVYYVRINTWEFYRLDPDTPKPISTRLF